MNEWSKRADEESFPQYRERFSNEMSQLTKIVGKEQYDELYRPVLEYFGIRSPAILNTRTHEIIISDDVPDKDYLGFLGTHELWEDYIINKSGFNLNKTESEDEKLPINDQVRPAHRVATYKEFCHAKEEGKLDEYFQWWGDFYSKDISAIEQLPIEEIERISKNYNIKGHDNPRGYITNRIRNNWDLKKQIYEKVKSL